MAEKVPECRNGKAYVEHFDISEEEASWSTVRGSLHIDELMAPGRFAKLVIGNTVMMSDTIMERRTNTMAVLRSHGHVLIAGLGMGMLLWPILARKSVLSLTVVEKDPEVFDLILPYVPDDLRLSVEEGDIFTYKPTRKYNTIYFDIWADISTNNLGQMTKLRSRYAPHLDRNDPDRWIGSWREHELAAKLAQERAYERCIIDGRELRRGR
jgi:hypothetical protein